ncbi:hypothetical protein HF289_10120 [Acidithiobacillus ferrooxidans]|jgi:hypothetical protein|uniref:hypothetical protein n=1 Tax=Acidithiobacillus ferrooxidans TaxID=920 RepID=UPI001C0789C1|nr:hypothetical protein [Acidithiobacillus ferrooxidans]MBU2857206.1 hypothetical protein [Acidithiobacillus ferrooxidans]
MKKTMVLNGQSISLTVLRVTDTEVDVSVASKHGASIAATLRAVNKGYWGVLRINLHDAARIAPDSESFRILQTAIYDLAVGAAHSQERKAA